MTTARKPIRSHTASQTGKHDAGASLPFRYRTGSRLVRLAIGLVLYGVSIQFQLASALGNQPWSVLDQGVSRHTGISVGVVVMIVAALVLLCWIPLRQRPGLGTIATLLLIGPAVDATALVLPTPHGLPLRISYMLIGVVLCAAATGLYIGAHFGPGPRDGLMTGLAKRGLSIRVARTMIEVAVVIVGFLLGGTFGVGTILFAFSIGPLAQVFIPLFEVRRPPVAVPEPAPAAA